MEFSVSLTVYIANSKLCDVIFGTTSLLMHSGAVAYPDVYFSNGSRPYHLDDVHCSGSESSLLSCRRGYSIGIHNCEPGKAAGVKCGKCMMGEIATWNSRATLSAKLMCVYIYAYTTLAFWRPRPHIIYLQPLTSYDQQNGHTSPISKPINLMFFIYLFPKTADTFKHIGNSVILH